MVRSKHALIAIGCVAVLWLEGKVPAVAYQWVWESVPEGQLPADEPFEDAIFRAMPGQGPPFTAASGPAPGSLEAGRPSGQWASASVECGGSWPRCSADLAPRAEATPSEVQPLEVPATAFAGAELCLRFTCREKLHVAWQASAARRPFASGVVASQEGRAEIRFRTPEIKEGVVLPIQVAAGQSVCKILVFGKNPLAGRQQWAEQLRIVLFDPPGQTAKACDSVALPYRRVTTLGALAAATGGTVVVGEGLALDDHRGLGGVLSLLARQGLPVVLLAPASGRLETDGPAPKRFEFQAGGAQQEIDPRTGADLTRSLGFRTVGRENGPALEVTDRLSDYAWADFRYDDTRGRLCCVAWSVLDKWETSPAPRFFLVRLLEIASSGSDLSGGKRA